MKSLLKKVVVQLLELESRVVLAKYKPVIIALTGSVGKTSTKDAVYTALTGASSIPQSVRKNQKSFNSELGVPLTILGQDNAWGSFAGWISILLSGLELIFLKTDYPKTLIVEVGADHPGDIKNIVRWLKPDVAVVTKIGKVPVHVEFFPTTEAVANEKAELLKGLGRSRAGNKKGFAVMSADDEIVVAQKEKAIAAGATIITFGIQNPADVIAKNITTIYSVVDGRDVPTGMSFDIVHATSAGTTTGMQTYSVALNDVLGVQHVYPVLGAVAVSIARGVDISAAVAAFAHHEQPRGRMNLLAGQNSTTLIDDSYNASPDAVEQALAELKALRVQGRRIAALGDMLELGKYSSEQHLRAGGIVAATADVLITVGMRSKGIAQGARDAGMDQSCIHVFENSYDAGEFLKSFIAPGDVVLIKGSQSIRMERITRMLMKDADHAPDLLVRQDSAWLAKK